jgi:drug/metabolite transporter (DMT)-like permease
MLHLLALLGVLSISFSAIFVRLAQVSPVTATFFRCAYAVPILAAIWMARKAQDHRTRRERAIALLSGLILAVDLAVWHESIAFIGAGLGTVIANVQVVFVALAAWLLFGERPRGRTLAIVAFVLVGVTLTSGLAGHDAYGSRPVAGVALGVLSGVAYAAYLLIFRAATQSNAPTVGPLLDSTVGAALGALVCALFDRHFSIVPFWPAHLWLVLLAVVSQVVGWLMISAAIPQLPAIETSIMLLLQPVGSVLWGILLFGEHLSRLQWIGTAIVLGGVALHSLVGSREPEPRAARPAMAEARHSVSFD